MTAFPVKIAIPRSESGTENQQRVVARKRSKLFAQLLPELAARSKTEC